jgi:hypothetical protein
MKQAPKLIAMERIERCIISLRGEQGLLDAEEAEKPARSQSENYVKDDDDRPKAGKR